MMPPDGAVPPRQTPTVAMLAGLVVPTWAAVLTRRLVEVPLMISARSTWGDAFAAPL
jgi:hypothetical protein